MSTERKATKRAPKEHADRFGSFPSAGPYPNITGMKKQFWGLDAYCVRCGAYVYKVDQETWERY